MSLVNLAHVCSHLQNASKARLGLTSIPPSRLILTLALALQHHGYISSVAIGGPTPPPPTLLSTPSQISPDTSSSYSSSEDGPSGVTQTNIASRRLWLGLKYWDNQPVLSKMCMVSKPTRRIWMGREDLEGLARGEKRGYVVGLREVGESMFVSTDRGVMEVREAVERGVGGMLLCRVV